MAPVAVTPSSPPATSTSSKHFSSASCLIHISGSDVAFAPSFEPYQRRLKLVENDPNEPEITFSLVLRPTRTSSKDEPLAKQELIEAIKSFAPAPSTEYQPSKLQHLMDAHGGAVHFKGLPIQDANDFSNFMHALAGRSIGSHNEYGLYMHYPSVIAFCCLSAPTSGGQTPIVNSMVLYDRLKSTVPGYIEKISRQGLTFFIHHPVAEVKDSVKGNSLYSSDSFGPTPEEKVNLDSMTEEQKRKLVEDNILELAREGGWGTDLNDQVEDKLGAWHERGFSWTWLPDGSINVFQRVPGIRIHPTLGKPAYFNNVGNRYAYSKEHGCLRPPHYSEEKRDFFPPPSFPRPLSEGEEEDEAIPLDWLQEAHRWTECLQAHVEWEQGDVLLIDNLAVQHARTPWSGPRKLVASLWDQRSYLDKNLPSRT
ncbi:uncharacterized protein UBRO2_05039 [Ustilago bromivora]|uniref:TauD/TfdA-like domain-containing protein n=1 Tax=Ustilago bromivora TaxID=307758 RepID=A0A8H8TUC6_9BASI|nr:uncharacterized protein UBRO2_05039 [Ustilago bromivora]